MVIKIENGRVSGYFYPRRNALMVYVDGGFNRSYKIESEESARQAIALIASVMIDMGEGGSF
jgi:hypothetical protein